MANDKQIKFILTADDIGLKTAVTRARIALSTLSGQAKAVIAPFRKLTSAATDLRTILLTIAAGAGMQRLTADIITASREMNRLKLAFDALSGGDASLAAEEFEFVRKTAAELGLDLQTAAEGYKQLAAAAKDTNLEGEETKKAFIAISKAAMTLGLDADNTKGTIYALGQMISKGKVSAEELRVQMGDRLPGAFQLAAKAMGMTAAELDKAMKDGKVFTNEFLPKFADVLEERFGKGAEKAATGFEAAWNRVKTALWETEAAVGQAATNNTFFAQSLALVSTYLNGVSADAKKNAQAWRDLAKNGVLAIVDGVKFGIESLRFFANAWQGLKLVAQASITAMVTGLEFLVKATRSFLKPLDLALTGLAKIGAIDSNPLKDLEETLDGFGDYSAEELKKIWTETETLNDRFDGASTAVDNLRKKLETFKAEAIIADTAEQTKKVETEFVQIGKTWVEVQKGMAAENRETADQMPKDWGDAWIEFQRDGERAAERVDKALDAATKPREVVVTVKEVQKKRWGGMIRLLASGGRLPGFGGGDRIPALLEAGEFVIRKEAVAKFGAGVFSALNNLRLPKFQVGGPVLPPMPQKFSTGGEVSSPTQSNQAGLVIENMTFSFPGGAPQATRQNARDMARMVMAELKRLYARGA